MKIYAFPVWVARALVLAVFVINIMCALSFILFPELSVDAYQLAGAGLPGAVAIQGIGITFLMWNATYPLVIVNPSKFWVLFIIVIAQQIIGLVGELILYFSLPAGYAMLSASIMRFVVFDAIGLVLLLLALVLSRVRFVEKASHQRPDAAAQSAPTAPSGPLAPDLAPDAALGLASNDGAEKEVTTTSSSQNGGETNAD